MLDLFQIIIIILSHNRIIINPPTSWNAFLSTHIIALYFFTMLIANLWLAFADFTADVLKFAR